MQTERIQICSTNLLKRGCCGSWYQPLEQDASIEDVSMLFARYMLSGEQPDVPLLKHAFHTLKHEKKECMFVFMRRNTSTVLGILRSTKPLLSSREQTLLQQLGRSPPWNLPIWTWSEKHSHFEQMMEQQCQTKDIRGPCMGMWCYR